MPTSPNNPTLSHDFLSLAQHTVVSRLDDAGGYGLLEINGIDSAKFLQGQLTCNLQDINTEQSRLGAHCTHKGRMVSNFRLMQADTTRYLFLLPTDTLGALQKSLGKYIVFSKAKLNDASSAYVVRGISGSNAAAIIFNIFGAAPNEKHAQHCHENGIVICIDTQPARFLCVIPKNISEDIDEKLSGSIITDHHFWNWLDIASGIGHIRTETIEEFTPQMLNMQLTDGISFTKGCYTGQEIVARMQYRGILKKAMYHISGNGTAPSPNTVILQENDTQAVGHIVNAEIINDDQWEALAVINHDAIEHPLHLDNASSVTVLSLPYAL